MLARLPPVPTSSHPLVLLERVQSAQCIQPCIPSQISLLSPEKHPETFLRNSSCVSSPSAPCIPPSISHFCFTGRIDHRGRRQGLPLRGHSFLSFLRFLQSYTTSQGGRLVTERRMVTDMYVFDLKTLIWEKVAAPSDDCTPAQRYFHSADSCESRYPRFIIAFDHFSQGTNISSSSVAWG